MLLWVLVAAAAPVELGPAPGGGISFELESSAGPTHGRLDVFTANLDPERRTGQFMGSARSLHTDFGPRDQRLLYYAMDVVTFPSLRFDLSRIEGSVAELASLVGSGAVRLLGELNIRDVRSPVAIPATFAYQGGELHLQGETTLQWAAFGIPDPTVLVAKVGPTVRVTFDLVGKIP